MGDGPSSNVSATTFSLVCTSAKTRGLFALAGLVAAARLGAGAPNAGLNCEWEAIAAAFLGGASASGGVGTVLGAVIGGVLIGVLNNGMILINISTDWQQIVKGLVLLAAVWFDVYNKKKAGGEAARLPLTVLGPLEVARAAGDLESRHSYLGQPT